MYTNVRIHRFGYTHTKHKNEGIFFYRLQYLRAMKLLPFLMLFRFRSSFNWNVPAFIAGILHNFEIKNVHIDNLYIL